MNKLLTIVEFIDEAHFESNPSPKDQETFNVMYKEYNSTGEKKSLSEWSKIYYNKAKNGNY